MNPLLSDSVAGSSLDQANDTTDPRSERGQWRQRLPQSESRSCIIWSASLIAILLSDPRPLITSL